MDEKQDRRIEKGYIVLAVVNILVFLYMFTIGMAGDIRDGGSNEVLPIVMGSCTGQPMSG